MKRFIKVLTAAAVLVAAAQGVWAGGYKGDLQLTGGFRGMKMKGDVGDVDGKAGSGAFLMSGFSLCHDWNKAGDYVVQMPRCPCSENG